MKNSKIHCSRAYWNNYIESIIDSINEDRDSILDILTYGSVSKATITMIIDPESNPRYQIKVEKNAEKSPFGEDEEE